MLWHKGVRTSNRCPCSFPGRGWGVGADQWVRSEGWLRWSAHPLGGAVCRDHAASTLLLLLEPQKWQLGFGRFCTSFFIICPGCTCRQLFSACYGFFVFCCWSSHLPRCKHCSTGSWVPAFLKMRSTSSVLSPGVAHPNWAPRTISRASFRFPARCWHPISVGGLLVFLRQLLIKMMHTSILTVML